MKNQFSSSNRFTLVLATLAVILAGCNIDGSCFLPQQFVRIIEPENPVTLTVGESITFKGEACKDIFWSSTGGTFDKSIGKEVIFTAPLVPDQIIVSAMGYATEFPKTATVTVKEP